MNKSVHRHGRRRVLIGRLCHLVQGFHASFEYDHPEQTYTLLYSGQTHVCKTSSFQTHSGFYDDRLQAAALFFQPVYDL